MKIKRLMAGLLCGAVGAATLGLSGCGNAADSGMMDAANANAVAGGSSDLPVITWKMGSTWGDGNIHFTCDERFSELVSQLTDGRFTITNYPEGSLCAANQLFDYVQNGTIQCGGDWGGYWSGKDTAFELLSTTMDNFTGMDYYIWITQGGGLKCYQDMYGKYNISHLQGYHKEKPPKMDGFNYFRYSPMPEGGSLGYSSSSKLSNGPLRPERWSLVYSTFSSTPLSISFLACAEGSAE